MSPGGPSLTKCDILPIRIGVVDGISTGTHLGVWFVDVTEVRALFVRVADGSDAEAPSLQVVIVTLVSEEFSVT